MPCSVLRELVWLPLPPPNTASFLVLRLGVTYNFYWSLPLSILYLNLYRHAKGFRPCLLLALQKVLLDVELLYVYSELGVQGTTLNGSE